jgi:hypothetical protein
VIELDHVIIFCSRGAPEAAALRAQGLLDGSGQAHAGQGTANRRFSFANAYLELLWVEDETEARSTAVERTQLWERWQGRTAGLCPLGLAFRPGGDGAEEPPFLTWSYRPSYLPAELSIEMGIGVRPTEPLLVYLPFARRDRLLPSVPVIHPAGVRELVGLRLHLPEGDRPSDALRALTGMGLVSLSPATDYLAELAFLGEAATAIDLRPQLPLIFRPHAAAA